MKHSIHCPKCGQPLSRVVTGNVIYWSHNPASGATKCPSK